MRLDQANLTHGFGLVLALSGPSLRRGLASSGNAVEASLMATTVLLPLAAAAVCCSSFWLLARHFFRDDGFAKRGRHGKPDSNADLAPQALVAFRSSTRVDPLDAPRAFAWPPGRDPEAIFREGTAWIRPPGHQSGTWSVAGAGHRRRSLGEALRSDGDSDAQDVAESRPRPLFRAFWPPPGGVGGLSVARLRRTLGCTTSDAAAVWEDSNVRRGGACCPAREGGDTAVPIARRWRRRQSGPLCAFPDLIQTALHSRGRPERWRRLGRSG